MRKKIGKGTNVYTFRCCRLIFFEIAKRKLSKREYFSFASYVRLADVGNKQLNYMEISSSVSRARDKSDHVIDFAAAGY